MGPNEFTIFIVDDDASVRDALGLLLGLHHYPVVMFADAESFLNAYSAEWSGCLLLDIRMPGMDGLALQKRLQDVGSRLPVVVMTGHGNVVSARAAFKAEAVDFLEKPVDENTLLRAIEEALRRQRLFQAQVTQVIRFKDLEATLSPREHEVMGLVVAGRHNREIAQLLGLSVRTVEVHKAHMMTKLQVKTVPDLVRLCLSFNASECSSS